MSHRQVTKAQARRTYVADDSGQNQDLLPTWTRQHGRLLEVFGQNIVRKSKVSDRLLQYVEKCIRSHTAPRGSTIRTTNCILVHLVHNQRETYLCFKYMSQNYGSRQGTF